MNQQVTAATTRDSLSSSAEFSPDVAEQLRTRWDQQAVDGATSDVVYRVLYEAIIMSILPAGQWLGEVQLARLFEVSRTPVREAILRLEADHLAVRIPRRGLVVSKITPQETIDVYVVREAIDGLAAALAADMATPTEIFNLELITEQFARAAEEGDLDALAGPADRDVVDYVLFESREGYPGRAMEAAEAHRALVRAIAEHDAERARAIAMKDMAVARRIRVGMLQSEGESTNDALASSKS